MNNVDPQLNLHRRACLRVGARTCVLMAAPLLANPLLANNANNRPPVPPSEVLLNLPQAVLRGAGRLSFLGLHVYDARLWVEGSFSAANYAQHPMALELQYARKLQGPLIAERSITEIRKLQDISDAKAEAWLAQLVVLFPNVGAGDRITGIQRPGQSSLFYVNALARGEIQDTKLAQAFFSIWFSPRTSEPKLRAALLQPQGPP